ncbi:e2c3886c-1247-4775-a0a1-9232f1c471dd [Sclerotinia trifoliorum]|uniref:E2c3886c-1247-4775-a0a1-9232f1c471dd n=1 Tax=Sclerotinia trifoliorum TaxID=28548 RepID=A0A8H2W263_9HELO|nr:e2c3886c-1247-4775-a0a1-9232f1c471dd [Sclerotinia trifoliorum]
MPRHVHLPLPRELRLRRSQYEYGGTTLNSITTANIVVHKMTAVPGFLASAAFFTFLRANLVLPPSSLNSTYSTPILYASSSQTLPPLRPSSLATMSSNIDDDITVPNPLEGIPSLATTALTTEEDKTKALKLIADSIAQQRQIAAQAIIFHPLTLTLYTLIIGIVTKWQYTDTSDLGLLGTTLAGVTMACLVAVRAATAGYLHTAEEFNWDFARNDDGEEDVIIGSRYGDEIIGALILRIERAPHINGSPKRGKSGKKGGKGVVRAWTTKVRYRGTGVGTEMLEEAVRETRGKLGNSAEVGFAKEHANAKMILPEMFNGEFRKRERRAAGALEAVLESARGKKR